jgi:(1->4)-alpha-D-glucan 1-alpha-D-glucosylmutase
MKAPSSTYRLQLRGGVDFDRAAQVVEVIDRLGADWLYVSPLLQARPGSLHGYDVLDPSRLDEELGGDEGFSRLAQALARHGRGLLLDIVPNHMVADAANPWWRDLLEHGVASVYAEFFDIRFAADPEGRLVLPVLGRHYGEALEAGELVPAADARGFVVRNFDRVFALDPKSWAKILGRAAEKAAGSEAGAHLSRLTRMCDELPPRVDEPAVRERRAHVSRTLRRELQLTMRPGPAADAVHAALRTLAGVPGQPSSFDPLHALLEEQSYRLAFWRAGLGEINYRRFFDIPDLVALRAERDDVFEATHARVLELHRRGCVSGLRIDHVDGLADPRAYLERLRGAGVDYVVVEKILGHDEPLRETWPTVGTTGYELIRAIAPLFIDVSGWRRIHTSYLAAKPPGHDLSRCILQSKLEVVDEAFAPGLHRLVRDLRRLRVHDRHARDVSVPQLERALRAITASLDVYRTYLDGTAIADEDRRRIELAAARARAWIDEDDEPALRFIVRVLLEEHDDAHHELPSKIRAQARAFVRRWQQLTGPVMAKGLEDTAHYRWLPLAALNEVGSEASVPADASAAFFAFATERAARSPAALSTTASHDTKRGEDVRARLYVLTELAEDWLSCRDLCVRELEACLGHTAVDPDEMELLLQTFVGAWPLHEDERAGFGERLRAYVIKAMREAKRTSSWLAPNEAAEAAAVARVDALLGALADTAWGQALASLQAQVAFAGAINSLAQVVLKLACPGVPDVYQGTEHWDLSLVDPDNRRPVDIARLARELTELDGMPLHAETFRRLRDGWTDGLVKLWVLHRGLLARRERAELFLRGRVVPLQADGLAAHHTIAFAREHGEDWAVAIVPRLCARLVSVGNWPLGDSTWRGSFLPLPTEAPSRWTDVLTGHTIARDDRGLALAPVLEHLPLALLVPSEL